MNNSFKLLTKIALGDSWCYLRFNLTKEQLEELDRTTKDTPEVITLPLPAATPDMGGMY